MKENQFGIPQMGFGTYGRRGEDGIGAILSALETGYRHIDTAQDYGTEAEVGEAIRRAGIARDAVFVTTKVATGNLGPGRVIPSIEDSLKTTGLDVLDLTLIHWPAPNGAIAPEVYLEQLAQAQERGLTRLIGVSNFTIALLDMARAIVGDNRIATNQIELNPLIQNKKVATYCDENAIVVTCFQPIAQGRVSAVPALAEIAARHDATPEQVALAFELAKGYAVIPTSGKPDRIRTNFAATRLALSPSEIATIETLDANQRAIDPDWGPDWD